MTLNIKYMGEQAIAYLIEKCKSTFALITHKHTASEVGADAQGSASAALVLANQHTDEKIGELSNTYETKDDSSSKLEDAKSYTDTEVGELAINVAYIDVEDNEDIVDPDISMSDITVDSALSETSMNPVQNKVVTEAIDKLSEEKVDQTQLTNSVNNALEIAKNNGTFNGLSAYQVAVNNGFVGTEKEWIASLHAANPIVLSKTQYPKEVEAIAYMDGQGNDNAVYVWDNKVYCSASYEITQNTGAFLYNYRASGSSGIVVAEGRSLLIIPVSSFTPPLTIDYSPYAISISAHFYGLQSLTSNPITLIANDGWGGNTDPKTVTEAQLQGCSYVCFAVTTTSKPSSASVKVNDTVIPLTVITDKTQIESAMSSGTVTANGFTDSGIEFTKIVGQNSCQQYLDDRNTYVFPVPSGYCESKVEYNTNGTHYLSKYDFATMTGMFTALATDYSDYVTETLLGQDATGTYDIKSYVLDAPSAISDGYESAMSRDKPVFIITSGLHGVEPDAVHAVYHFMKDLCDNYMENEQLEYLRNNVKFVIVPLSNPWGYVNQSYYNSNNVDLNKNFKHGYQTNGTANTGTGAYSEVETQLLKGVFDMYSDAIFHLECHGKYGEDTSFAQTIWFSLMRSLNSDLIELCAESITKQIGRRLYKLGYATNKSVGGYITYYGMNGRPKDYTGTEYGMLSCTMEGTGKIYGTSGYSVDTQKVNCEAIENFILRVLDALNSRVEVF